MTRGQFIRLFLSSDGTNNPVKVIAAAKSLQFHVSASVENATTKDTDSDWTINEVTAVNFDISTGALVRSDETITSSVTAQALADLETIYTNSVPVNFKIANVTGDNNRTASSTIVSGKVVLSQLTITAPNRQTATYDAQMSGWGEYTVGA